MNDLQDFAGVANKEFGDNTVIILNEEHKVDVDVIPTGIEIVDNAIGVGGIPRGRISEVFGKEGCGKTTLCMHAISSAQKMGLNCAFVDAEHSISVDMLERLDVDMDRFVLSQPNSGEDALNLVEMMVKSDKFALIVVDSVAALTPQAEVEKDMGESVMGVHARLMSQAMRKLTAPVSKHNVALLFTNQTRTKIGGYVAGDVTTGGNALKFYSSLRMEMKYKGKIVNTSGERISGKYQMTVVKNKLAVPFKVAEFEINARGIDGMGAFVDKLVETGHLTKSGAFYKVDGNVVAQGKSAMVDKLYEDADLKTELVQRLHKQV